jgi:hypothetical protein
MERVRRALVAVLLGWAWCLVCIVPAKAADDPPGVMEVGSRKQLFVDDLLIDSRWDVELVMNSPHSTGELLLTADQPHEEGGNINLYCCVLKESDGRIRVWYDLLTPTGPGPYEHQRRVCYAESTDGVTFVKPELGLFEVRGSKKNNVVIPGVIGGSSVWIDPHAPPEHRYKTQAKVYPSGRFHMHSSPDGVHWTLYAEIPPQGPHDTQTIIFWDEPSQRYLFYGRHRAITPEIDILCRSVRRAELTDLTKIENTGLAIWPDQLDRAKHEAPAGQTPVDYYGATVFPYSETEGLYIMLAQAFWHWQPTDAETGTLAPGMRDVRLAVSRDSKTFTRVGDRRPFMRPGPSGRFDSRQIWAMPNPIIMDDEVWIYYSALNWDRTDATDPAAPQGQRVSGVGRAVMRLDGFVSVDAPYSGGEFTTPPMRFAGDKLVLNVDTSAGGGVRVELLDESGESIPEFSGENAPWLIGNSVRFPVHWRGKPELSRWADKPIRLRFSLRDAKLYAFQFGG